MAYTFKASNYDRDAVARKSSSAEIPPAGSIVAVRIMADGETQYEWAGTKEKTSRSGRPMFQFHCVVDEGWEGERCWIIDYLLLDTDYTDARMGSMLEACGFDLDVDGYNVTPEMFVNRRGYVRIKHEEYKGKTRAKISYWVSPSNYEKLGLEPLGAYEPAESEEIENNDEEGEDGLPF